jgi:hypothetical protein
LWDRREGEGRKREVWGKTRQGARRQRRGWRKKREGRGELTVVYSSFHPSVVPTTFDRPTNSFTSSNKIFHMEITNGGLFSPATFFFPAAPPVDFFFVDSDRSSMATSSSFRETMASRSVKVSLARAPRLERAFWSWTRSEESRDENPSREEGGDCWERRERIWTSRDQSWMTPCWILGGPRETGREIWRRMWQK